MAAFEVQHFLGRARDFLKGMESLVEEEFYVLDDDIVSYKYSPALLGIHGAISYCDALRMGLGSEKLSSDDHRSAAVDLKSLLASRKFEKLQGVDRLGKLLSRKSRIAYAAEATREDEINDIVVQAERFAAWAEAAGKSLMIEGW
jgi:hypothetical protein